MCIIQQTLSSGKLLPWFFHDAFIDGAEMQFALEVWQWYTRSGTAIFVEQPAFIRLTRVMLDEDVVAVDQQVVVEAWNLPVDLEFQASVVSCGGRREDFDDDRGVGADVV